MDTTPSSLSKVSMTNAGDESKAAPSSLDDLNSRAFLGTYPDSELRDRRVADQGPETGSKAFMQACIDVLALIAKAPGRLWRALRCRWQHFRAKSKPVRGLLWWLLVNLVFDIPYCLFVYSVLIKGHIRICNTVFDAVTANLLVSIFSQISATFVDTMLREYLAVVRFRLAARQPGTRAATFIGIGPSSQWTSTAVLVLTCRALNVFMMLRRAIMATLYSIF